VPEPVLVVRRFAGLPHRVPGDAGGNQVDRGVDRLGEDGDRAGEKSHGQFAEHQ